MELGEPVVSSQYPLHLACQLQAHLDKPETVRQVPVLAGGGVILDAASPATLGSYGCPQLVVSHLRLPCRAHTRLARPGTSRSSRFIDLLPKAGQTSPVATHISQALQDLRDAPPYLMDLLTSDGRGESGTAQALQRHLKAREQ